MGRRSVDTSVEFLDAARATQQIGSRVTSWTKNIFVQSFGPYCTIITHTISTITRRAYNVPVNPHALVLRANHERLRLKRVEFRQTCHRELIARIRQDIREEVSAEWGASLSNDSDDGWLKVYDSNL